MADILRIFKLKIKSSYTMNQELPADQDFDTLQFYVHDDIVWRIKTYAVDSDLHVHQIPLRGRSVSEILEFLATSTKEHYGDVMTAEYTLSLPDNDDAETTKKLLREHNLSGKLETRDRFTFWNPNNALYDTKSNPLG